MLGTSPRCPFRYLWIRPISASRHFCFAKRLGRAAAAATAVGDVIHQLRSSRGTAQNPTDLRVGRNLPTDGVLNQVLDRAARELGPFICEKVIKNEQQSARFCRSDPKDLESLSHVSSSFGDIIVLQLPVFHLFAYSRKVPAARGEEAPHVSSRRDQSTPNCWSLSSQNIFEQIEVSVQIRKMMKMI